MVKSTFVECDVVRTFPDPRKKAVCTAGGTLRESGLDGSDYYLIAGVALRVVVRVARKAIHQMLGVLHDVALEMLSSTQRVAPSLPIASLASCLSIALVLLESITHW